MLYELSQSVVTKLQRAGLNLTLAESCTGGMVSHYITQISGASSVYEGGVVAYSNAFKVLSLEVPQEMLDKYGAVSEQVARAMAAGLLKKSGSDISGSVTGIAGPDGGTPEKPIGTVHIAVATKDKISHRKLNLKGGRKEIQEQSAKQLFNLIKETIDNMS